MQLDQIIIGAKLIAALVILSISYLVILPYFTKPEEFFIKRFRPAGNQFTHTELLARAFVGGGFIFAGVQSFAYCLALSLDSDMDWKFAWPVITLVGGVIVGAANYAYFRLDRYRRLAPGDRTPPSDSDESVFVRRAGRDGSQD